MSTILLGVPDHARTEWDALGDALATAATPAPCQSADRDLWAGNPASQRKAATRCLDCPAMLACGAYAAAAGERAGVWGGLTAREREAARKASQTPPRAARRKGGAR